MTNQYGPKTKFADDLHAMKYRGPNEDFREAMNRISFALKDSDNSYHANRDILLNMRFMPAGRIQNAMGASRRTTAYNCFVSGTVEDSYVDGEGSIMGRAQQAAATMRMGGGIGYDFSGLRPRGARVAKIDSISSGPISFMPIFDAVCLATSSYGHRRGAQMGMLRVDHPDIEEFIGAKNNRTALQGFNISVAVTDEFMEAVKEKKEFDLRWGGTVYKTIDAVTLWQKIMRSTYDWAEPGVVFIDRMNDNNNLWYCEKIAATNPCAEQPLPPFGACLLGSFNLTKYIDEHNHKFNYDHLVADIPHVTRAMDNVVDRSHYPLPQQKAEAVTKRRMGLGIAGLANAGEFLGFPYGSGGFIEFEKKVLATITEFSYLASAELAREKGAFPLYDEDKYFSGEFISSLPGHVKDAIKKNGIRNSHLTSIAPTGTISMCADNISSGIEPVFSYLTDRTINTPEGAMLVSVPDYGFGTWGVKGKLAANVTVDEHIEVQLAAQPFVDSAISKTINMNASMPWEDFVNIYTRIHEGKGKGVSTFNQDGKRMALLTAASPKVEADGEAACEIIDGRRNCE